LCARVSVCVCAQGCWCVFVRKGVGLVLLSLACRSALTCYEVCWCCSCGSSLALLLRLCVVCVWLQSFVCELCGGVVALQLRQSPARQSCASLASVLLQCCCVFVVALLVGVCCCTPAACILLRQSPAPLTRSPLTRSGLTGSPEGAGHLSGVPVTAAPLGTPAPLAV